jgi:hypothetical protein
MKSLTDAEKKWKPETGRGIGVSSIGRGEMP